MVMPMLDLMTFHPPTNLFLLREPYAEARASGVE